MKSLLRCSLFCLVFLLPATLSAQAKVLFEWKFDRPESLNGWGKNHAELKVENGSLRVSMTGRDPFLVSPPLKLDASRWQVLEAKIKTDSEGSGDLYFTNTSEGSYGGFDNKKRIVWKTTPDGQWHEYRLFPFWEAQKKIIKFRLDFPNLQQDRVGKRKAEIEWIRIVDLGPTSGSSSRLDWNMKDAEAGFSAAGNLGLNQTPQGLEVTQTGDGDGFIMSPLFSGSVDDCGYIVCIEMESVGPKDETVRDKGTIRFATNKGEFVDVPFVLDDVPVYNIDLSRNKNWSGDIRMIGLKISDQPRANAIVKRIVIGDEPQGPAFVQLDRESLGFVNASNRAGRPLPFEIRGSNVGGQPVTVRFDYKLPDGISAAFETEAIEVEPGTKFKKTVYLRADQAVAGDMTIQVFDAKTGKELATASTMLNIGASLNLPKATYVPEPKPVKSKYDIGALYYPGWEYRRAWDRIEPVAPIRKPMLGWYDEANVECIDWQIKWCVENGINTMYVDWYSNRGKRHHEHWINGFKKARYREYMKYAIMWANHNGPEAHSYEDQKSVTEFWCKNLFNDPQYEYIL